MEKIRFQKNSDEMMRVISEQKKSLYLKAKAIVSNISFIGPFDNFLHLLPPH